MATPVITLNWAELLCRQGDSPETGSEMLIAAEIPIDPTWLGPNNVSPPLRTKGPLLSAFAAPEECKWPRIHSTL